MDQPCRTKENTSRTCQVDLSKFSTVPQKKLKTTHQLAEDGKAHNAVTVYARSALWIRDRLLVCCDNERPINGVINHCECYGMIPGNAVHVRMKMQ